MCAFFATVMGIALIWHVWWMVVFGTTGGLDGQAFMPAVTRASEICVGIACAGIVLAGTDLGTARRHLAEGADRSHEPQVDWSPPTGVA
jgi:uncharacterized membrane protein YccC